MFDWNSNNYDHYQNNPQSKIYLDFMMYIRAEDDLECMVKDNVVDIYVDNNGEFHYTPSKQSIDNINSMGINYTASSATFTDMLAKQGLNIKRYKHYIRMLRKKNRR